MDGPYYTCAAGRELVGSIDDFQSWVFPCPERGVQPLRLTRDQTDGKDVYLWLCTEHADEFAERMAGSITVIDQ